MIEELLLKSILLKREMSDLKILLITSGSACIFQEDGEKQIRVEEDTAPGNDCPAELAVTRCSINHLTILPIFRQDDFQAKYWPLTMIY